MKSSYLTPGLLVLVLLIALGWFIAAPASQDGPVVSPQASASTPAAVSSQRRPVRSSPFLASHEQAPAFTPDGENVAPSFHVEMEMLNKRLDASPQDTTALLRMARLKQDGHETEEAIAYYRRYLALRPGARQAWLDLTQCLGTLAQWDEALEATQTLLDRFPDDPAALYNLGAIYANTSRFDEARATWQRVTRQDADEQMKTMAEGALQRLPAAHP